MTNSLTSHKYSSIQAHAMTNSFVFWTLFKHPHAQHIFKVILCLLFTKPGLGSTRTSRAKT